MELMIIGKSFQISNSAQIGAKKIVVPKQQAMLH